MRAATDWIVTPVTAADVPTLVAVHTSAFADDNFSRAMLLRRPEGAHQAMMRGALQSWLADPDARLVKAATPTGAIAGWACWIRKTFAAPPVSSAVAPPADEPVAASAQGADKTRALGALMRSHQTLREERHLAGRTVLVLQGLATDPARQGQGAGSALVRFGTERADHEGLGCWAHASPRGRGLYARNGFEEVGCDEYVLGDWVGEGEEGEECWGRYVFRYMLRPGRSGGDHEMSE